VQVVPHTPQLLPSIVTFTHAEPHFVSPVGQLSVQAPARHLSPLPQTVPHAPQFRLSACVSLQTPPHRANGAQEVVQVPPEQT
jgi:hypothetical protein